MPGPKDDLDAARSPDTTADALRSLARSPLGSVRVAVAANPHTEPDVLCSLVPASVDSRDDQELLRAIAEHPNATPPILASLLELLVLVLAREHDIESAFAAGVTLCADERVPFDAIEALLSEPDTPREFRRVVARETPRRDVLEWLSNDRSGKVRKWAIIRLADPPAP